MSFNGKSGYFLEDDEYAVLTDLADQEGNAEYVAELEIEVHNLRHVVEETRGSAYDLFKTLDNA